MERKEFIKNEIKEEPNNPFNYYLLALELKKEGDLQKATDLFNTLLEQFPLYIPTYYSYADFLLEIEQEDKAKQIVQLGIERAEMAGQTKALHELKQMWDLNF